MAAKSARMVVISLDTDAGRAAAASACRGASSRLSRHRCEILYAI